MYFDRDQRSFLPEEKPVKRKLSESVNLAVPSSVYSTAPRAEAQVVEDRQRGGGEEGEEIHRLG